jgi:two-component system cell cycle response regulator
VAGLDAGADDFLTKPVRDLPLFSRVRSLTRLKLTTDELRRRAETAVSLVSRDDIDAGVIPPATRLALFADGADEVRRLQKHLKGIATVEVTDDAAEMLAAASAGQVDVILIDLAAKAGDPLRLVSQFRSNVTTRHLPVIGIVPAGDDVAAAKALELGANDYLQRPLDRNELVARIRTQLRRRRYDDCLRRSVEETIAMALSDPLTGLHNRRFLETHLAKAIERARATGIGFAILMADIDHFKRINDGWGHAAGDMVLKDFARRLSDCLRASDLACRFGGEEFAVLMIGADEGTAMAVADRIRRSVADQPFQIGGEPLTVTVSAGLAVFDAGRDDGGSLIDRADRALYEAKRSGRNRISLADAA